MGCNCPEVNDSNGIFVWIVDDESDSAHSVDPDSLISFAGFAEIVGVVLEQGIESDHAIFDGLLLRGFDSIERFQ